MSTLSEYDCIEFVEFCTLSEYDCIEFVEFCKKSRPNAIEEILSDIECAADVFRKQKHSEVAEFGAVRCFDVIKHSELQLEYDGFVCVDGILYDYRMESGISRGSVMLEWEQYNGE